MLSRIYSQNRNLVYIATIARDIDSPLSELALIPSIKFDRTSNSAPLDPSGSLRLRDCDCPNKQHKHKVTPKLPVAEMEAPTATTSLTLTRETLASTHTAREGTQVRRSHTASYKGGGGSTCHATRPETGRALATQPVTRRRTRCAVERWWRGLSVCRQCDRSAPPRAILE